MLRSQAVMSWRPALALALVAASATAGHATVWQRTRPDGTIEYTNVAPRGGSWSAVKEASKLRAASRRTLASVAPRPASITSASGGIVWSREHDDGTVEFTNVAPVGARW